MTNGEAKKNGGLDPTTNVLLLVEAAVRRLDDLRIAEIRRIDEQLRDHFEHIQALSIAEAKRIDAIRAVDTGAVASASEVAREQARTLATQVSTSAETLRGLVATTASVAAAQSQQISNELTKRIGALELTQSHSTGTEGGMRDMWGWIIGAIMTLIAIATFVLPRLK